MPNRLTTSPTPAASVPAKRKLTNGEAAQDRQPATTPRLLPAQLPQSDFMTKEFVSWLIARAPIAWHDSQRLWQAIRSRDQAKTEVLVLGPAMPERLAKHVLFEHEYGASSPWPRGSQHAGRRAPRLRE